MASISQPDVAPRASRPQQPSAPGSGRLVSLDVFRGVTIAAMILVNNPGTWSAMYAPLKHAEWHGWTPTDLIFPFFLFIVGVSMVYSFDARRERGADRGKLLRHTARRALIIFAIGFFLHAFPYFNMERVRIPGVLQRIAVVYLFAGAAFLYLGRRGRIITIASLLLGYWGAMKLIPVPGFGAGVLEPGADLGAYIDRALLSGHLWRPNWDPEGLLSTLPSIATCLLGGLCGEWLRSPRTMQEKARGMLLAGIAGLALGSVWGIWFPINKYLWTSSYVIFTAGFAAVCLAACYWAVDIRGWRKWATPFLVFGMNAIAAYGLSSLMSKMMGIYRVVLPDGRSTSGWNWIYQNWYAPLASPVNASLMMGLSFVLFWLAVMWILYARKYFIKV